jgi:hypothetical protein
MNWEYKLSNQIKTTTMNKVILIMMIFGSVLMSSCSRQLSYFTDKMYDDYNWSLDELKQIQFYVSEDIRLVRSFATGSSNIQEGQILIKDQNKVDEVIIRKGTPGTLIFSPGSDKFAVSFDEDPKNYLMFGPNEKASGRYVLLAKNWKKRGGIITYGEKEYRTTSESAFAALMVDISKARRSVKKTSTAKGRKISNG